MKKIEMETPIVEIDGDEMTRIIWQMIKETLILPYVDLKSEYYDLGLKNRNETNDQITKEAALAAKKYGVAVKCATITPNTDRVNEYGLKEMWKSPNGTIRSTLGGTIFRTPIITKAIVPFINGWTKPITIARHAYGDIYKCSETTVKAGTKAELLLTDKNGITKKVPIHEFKSDGVLQCLHNLDESIQKFAKDCFEHALETKQSLWFASKDTISKQYDHRFKDIFNELFNKTYKEKFKNAGIEYFYTLIDDAVARAIRSRGGYIWACKNYDGDVMSDMVASAFGSIAMMTSTLVSENNVYEYEAAHGTVQRHYYKHLNGEETSTNPIATIFAWTGALKKRGQLDSLNDLISFAEKLELASIQTIEQGVMTKDLFAISHLKTKKSVSTKTFLSEINNRLLELIK